VVSILGALMERQRSGAGRYLDISMLDGLVVSMGQAIAILGMTGNAPQRTGNAHPLASPYESFRCADRDIVIAVTNEKSWASFCRLSEIRAPREGSALRHAAAAQRQSREPAARGQRCVQTRPAAYWLEALEKLGIPAEPINTLDEIMAHPQLALRDMLLDTEFRRSREYRAHCGHAWRAVARRAKGPPGLGEHTQDVLQELGLLELAAHHDR